MKSSRVKSVSCRLVKPTFLYATISAELSSPLDPIPIKYVDIPVLSDHPSTVIDTSDVLRRYDESYISFNVTVPAVGPEESRRKLTSDPTVSLPSLSTAPTL